MAEDGRSRTILVWRTESAHALSGKGEIRISFHLREGFNFYRDKRSDGRIMAVLHKQGFKQKEEITCYAML